jgi:hypothetical protein
MEYFFGIGLAFATAILATITGFEKNRAFYPTVLAIIASYRDLFSAMGGAGAFTVETVAFLAFVALAVIGFKTNLWLVVAGLFGHAALALVCVIPNGGTPTWQPAFWLAFDAVVAGYLAWRLRSKKLAASPPCFRRRIRPHVALELAAADAAERAGDSAAAFRHLERAHVLGQALTLEHVGVHLRMFAWAVRNFRPNEAVGQLLRIAGAATKTAFGLIPQGNTGGSNVGPFRPMPVPSDLAQILATARAACPRTPPAAKVG